MTDDNDDGRPENRSLMQRAIDLALGLDPESIRAYAEAKRAANGDIAPRGLASRIVAIYSSKAGIEGFAMGIPANPFAAIPAGVADLGDVLRCYAGLAATIGYLANPKYFDDPDWRVDVQVMVLGPTVLSRLFREAGVVLGKQVSKRLIRQYIAKGTLKTLQRAVLKWFAKRLTQQTIITKTVPVIGGLIGGAWNYAEIRMVGKRAIRYHFDEARGE